MMIMVIILMFDDDNAQKSSTTMTLWSKYTPFKYYYLVKIGPKQPGRGWGPPPLTGQCPFKNVFFIWTPSHTMSYVVSYFPSYVAKTPLRHPPGGGKAGLRHPPGGACRGDQGNTHPPHDLSHSQAGAVLAYRANRLSYGRPPSLPVDNNHTYNIYSGQKCQLMNIFIYWLSWVEYLHRF